MKEEDAIKLLKSAKYVTAKSKTLPHSYTLRKDWIDEEAFENVVVFIRENGSVERFFSKHYTYYYLDGYKYWTMGSPINQTILINRARLAKALKKI